MYIVDKFISSFLDDLLGGARTLKLTNLFVICLLDLFYNLGVFFQMSKSQVVPTTEIVHLGFVLDVVAKKLKLTDK